MTECNHEPRDPIAAFFHICRDCGLPIAPELCEACDGTGAEHGCTHREVDCAKCSGTGVERWKATL